MKKEIKYFVDLNPLSSSLQTVGLMKSKTHKNKDLSYREVKETLNFRCHSVQGKYNYTSQGAFQ